MKFEFLKEEDDKIMDFMIDELSTKKTKSGLTDYHQGMLDLLLVLDNANDKPSQAWMSAIALLVAKEEINEVINDKRRHLRVVRN